MTEASTTTAERVARNQAIFREANERIQTASFEYGVSGEIPFICECADSTCTAILRIDLREYERVRADPTRFVGAPGHHRAAQGFAEVLESRDGYDIVEKRGEAAEIAADLDPRDNG